MKKIALILALIVSGITSVSAQSFGVGYAYSSTAPNSGLTAHFESSIISLGLASINSRVRATVFNSDGYNLGGKVFGETNVLIVDLSVMGKISVIPFVNPYAGLGIAYENADYSIETQLGNVKDNQSEFPDQIK